MIAYYSISALIGGLLTTFIVYFVYLRDHKTVLNRSFLYFGISVATWSLIYSAWVTRTDIYYAELLIRFTMFPGSFIPATFFHFVTRLTNTYSSHKRTAQIFYAISGLSAVLFFTPLMITGVEKKMIFDGWPNSGVLLPAYVLYYFAANIYSFAIVVKKYREETSFYRTQLGIVFIAFAIGFFGGSFNWFLWFDIQIAPFTNIFVAVAMAIFAFAVFRYGLMDLNTLTSMRSTPLSYSL